MPKAAVLESFKAALQLRDYPLPATLEPGAALVRTQMAGICGTDVHLWKGELPIQLPVILGHETVGIIEQLGPGLTHDWSGEPLRPGDRVTWTSTTSCGKCYYCAEKGQPTRCPQRRAYGIGYRSDQPPHFLGGYAEFHYLRPGANIFKIPDDLPTESVIGAGCALITAIHGIERTGIDWQDTVVVQGAGPVGIAALAVAKSAGASTVTVIGGPAHRLEMAERFGADHVIEVAPRAEPRWGEAPAEPDEANSAPQSRKDLNSQSPAEQRLQKIRALHRGYGADVVLECVGHPTAFVEGVEMCRDGGKYLVLGHYCNAGPIEFNPHTITRKQLNLFGSWSSEPRHMRAALDFLRRYRKEFPFHEMVTHRFKLTEADQALATTANWQSAKSVIIP